MRLLVGCPVLRRGWVLDEWHAHLQVASTAVGIDMPHLIFAGAVDDTDSFDVITRFPNPKLYVPTAETKTNDVRDWGIRKQRFVHMAFVRNELLAKVRMHQPDLFLSLDSDVLLAPDALVSMFEALRSRPEWGAVGGRCHLFPTDKTKFPSYAMWARNGIRRVDQPGGLFQVDCIFAIKLMRPAAYNVDYAYHDKGEDCGWAVNCKTAGVALGWDGRHCSKHVYSRDELHKVDKLAGF